MAQDILSPVVIEEKLNLGFKALKETAGFAPARAMIREVWSTFVDKDGNFVEQFQTTGFDSRIWELFLHAVLENLRAVVDPSHSSPDFNITYKGIQLSLEAVTANPSQKLDVVIDEELNRSFDPTYKQQEIYPIRLGSALYSKLQKRYWELPHVAGKPLIFAIQDFHEPGSLYYSGTSLWQYLYGIRGTWYFDSDGRLHVGQTPVGRHKYGSKEIPSGFFDLSDVENVSAVIFGNTGTVAKFNRMGFLCGYCRDEPIIMVRRGFCYDHEPNRAEPKMFAYNVGDQAVPPESWDQGLTVFHNHNALTPIPHQLFPFAYHFIDDGQLQSYLPDFHPFSSQTIILQAAKAGEKAR